MKENKRIKHPTRLSDMFSVHSRTRTLQIRVLNFSSAIIKVVPAQMLEFVLMIFALEHNTDTLPALPPGPRGQEASCNLCASHKIPAASLTFHSRS